MTRRLGDWMIGRQGDKETGEKERLGDEETG